MIINFIRCLAQPKEFRTDKKAPYLATISAQRGVVGAQLTDISHASHQIRARSFSTTNEKTRIYLFRPIKYECVFFEKQRARLSDFDTFQLSLHFRKCDLFSEDNLELA